MIRQMRILNNYDVYAAQKLGNSEYVYDDRYLTRTIYAGDHIKQSFVIKKANWLGGIIKKSFPNLNKKNKIAVEFNALILKSFSPVLLEEIVKKNDIQEILSTLFSMGVVKIRCDGRCLLINYNKRKILPYLHGDQSDILIDLIVEVKI